jgi:hypothetical protein
MGCPHPLLSFGANGIANGGWVLDSDETPVRSHDGLGDAYGGAAAAVPSVLPLASSPSSLRS